MLSLFGDITNPFDTLSPGNYTGGEGQDLITLVGNLVRLLIVVAGVYVLFNLIMAGYIYISAGGDPKNITRAWEKIWQSLLGLVIIAASFILAVIIGYVVYGPSNASILINPPIFGP